MTEFQTASSAGPAGTRPRRPRPQVVRLTDAAAERVRELMAKGQEERPIVGLRVGIKNGGCAGQEYTFAYADSIQPLDEVVEDKGAVVLIEPKAVLFLLGAEIDYEITRMASKFVFRNPNETDACGCGESVTIVPAKAPDALGA